MIYKGEHISGKGDAEKLKLIDQSFSMLHSTPTLPNLKMLYKSKTNMFSEGFIWGTGWWIQNSFGFAMGAIPLLTPFWFRILQNSYDAFWERIGDGKRIGADNGKPERKLYALCAPDGALGDCVSETGIIYRQGDGDFMSHDWFYEATAAGVFIQAEILLFDRRPEQLQKYIPLLWRSLNHIESVRAENGLFLVGPACNLLAPSYGGSYDSANDEVGKGYLTGITITYSAALKKCIEVMKLAGETTKADECYARLQKNISSLPLLLSEEGYLIKSMDPDGTKHGVYGAVKHGYFDAVCNIDAIAWDVVNRKTAESIYNKITSIKPLRSAGILCNNYPHIDDALPNYRNHTSEPSLPFAAGDWVDGGCWATVEGRAILAYQKLGKYEDSFRSAMYYMCWAEEYRQDAPLSQWGHNTNNPWVNENENYTICEHPVGIMIDNFAPVTCLLRGLFEYTADAEGLHITPHIPPEISELTQNEPIYFNGCSIYIHYSNGSGPLRATLDNIPLFTDSNGSITIPDTLLKRNQNVYLVIDHSIKSTTTVTSFDMTDQRFTGDITGVPHDIADIYYLCQERLKCSMNTEKKELISEIMHSIETAALRRRLPFNKHILRPMTDQKIKEIIRTYDQTVYELYNGLCTNYDS